MIFITDLLKFIYTQYYYKKIAKLANFQKKIKKIKN
jgi:hypothetical protein